MTPELGRRIAFTIGALLVYRLGTYVPLPGINPSVWEALYRSQEGGALGAFGALSGGGLQRLAIFALGIIPYISAAILLQLVMIVSARLRAVARRGLQGRSAIVRYTRILAIVLAVFQAYGIAVGLEGAGSVVSDPGWSFRSSTVVTLTGGTVFLIWLSDQMTARGIGNGIALLLAVGIVTELPSAIAGTLELGRQGAFSSNLILGLALLMIVVTALVTCMERARRHLPIEYSGRRADGREIHGRSRLAMKLNNAGLIPTILAPWVLAIPITLITVLVGQDVEWWNATWSELQPGRPWYMALYAALIIICVFFYTAFVLDPDEAAEDLKRYGGVVKGITPGEPTARYLDGVISRTSMAGALYLALVCLIPELLIFYAGVPFYFGGTSFMIIVCTALDIEAQVRKADARSGETIDPEVPNGALA